MAESALFEELNAAQREAVAVTDGPVLVVAGAGSGKTRVLTYRIAHLIRDLEVSPFEILAITFTNKAAGEMKDRVGYLVGGVVNAMWVSTFHSACVRILRREAHRLGYSSSFSIYDQADARRLVTYCVRDLDLDPKRFPPRGIAAAISNAKNELIDWESFRQSASGFYQEQVAEVYRLYQQRLLEASAMDFDDLLMVTVEVLGAFPAVLEHYQQRFRYILVDEYQDTNHAQYVLVKMLADKHRNLCVVGDSDQSIYAFRGADVRNILDFEKDWPDAKVVVLDRNYRSTQSILDAANAVISNNGGRKPKQLWTDLGEGEPLVRYEAEDEHDEAAFVAEEMGSLEDRGYRASDIAVFYRTNAQSRVLEEVFVRFGIPYQVIGTTKFYERKEIKDAVAYLRLLVNPDDQVAAKRVINEPKRGIGDTTVGHIDRHAQKNDISFWKALQEVEEIPALTPRAVTRVKEFLQIVDLLAELAEGGPEAAVDGVLTETGYLAAVEAEGTIEAMGRVENLKELRSVAAEFGESAAGQVDEDGTPWSELPGIRQLELFLEKVSLVADVDDLDTSAGAVTLMTIHNAKGLEFPVIFMVGMEDGVFPHIRSLGDPQELEEERRLCYVGVTRAREKLYLANAWSRNLWGGSNFNSVSRFIDEMPADLLLNAKRERRPDLEAASPRPSVGSTDLAAGDTVRHDSWGMGRVQEIIGEGDRAEAVVLFEQKGSKRLLLAWAPLTKV